MLRWLKNVLTLMVKEFRSLFSDPILMVLIVYMFSVAVIMIANSVSSEVRNASVAIVDYDRSTLSYRLQESLVAPQFGKVDEVSITQVDRLMDMGDYTFVLQFPANYERDLLLGRNPTIQLLIDATSMTQASIGANYINQIFSSEVRQFLGQSAANLPISPQINVLFNPNYTSKWFMAAMQGVGNLNLLVLLLVGAAVIRERERGTIEHLLVMPVGASEIAFAKILANGIVLLIVALLSLFWITKGVLGVPLQNGSIMLFGLAAAAFLFATASLGILLATLAPTMPQFGLLCLPTYIVMYMLSGTTSPVENMPEIIQHLTQFSPTTILGEIAQDVLFRNAPLALVWDKIVKIIIIGTVFLAIALMQFKSMLAKQG